MSAQAVSQESNNLVLPPSGPGRDDPIYKPAINPPNDITKSAVFIFCHGLADSAAALENIPDQFQQGGKLPWMSWIMPNAPFNNITLDKAWFTPNSLPYTTPSRPELEPDEDEEGMLQTVAYLESIIDAVVATGVPTSRIVLGGFSQGHAMSMLTHFTSSKYSGKLAGIVGLLGYLPLSDRKQRVQEIREARGMDRKATSVPMFVARGTKDEFIPKRCWDYSLEALRELGTDNSKMEVKFYEGLTHTINGAVLRDVCQWLESTVPEID